jgi:hypothetical protein
MRKADEFLLHYRPKINLQTGQITTDLRQVWSNSGYLPTVSKVS